MCGQLSVDTVGYIKYILNPRKLHFTLSLYLFFILARPIVCPVERTNGYQQKKVKVNITKCCEQCDVQSCVISYEVNGTVCHINSDVSRQQNEAEVMVPFETTKLKAEVEYRNFGSIESTELYTSNSNLDKVVKSKCM